MTDEVLQNLCEWENFNRIVEGVRECGAEFKESAAEFMGPVFPYIVIIVMVCGVLVYFMHDLARVRTH